MNHHDAEQCPLGLKVLGAAIVLGTGLGFGLHLPKQGSTALEYVSSVLGWTYFAVWSISFYPQVYLNWRRKSVGGLSFDFLLLNLIGFVAYSIFNWAMLLDANVREEYSKRNKGHASLVKLNDAVFATHGALLTLVTIAQCFVYDGDGQRVSTSIQWAAGAAVALSCASLAAIELNLIPSTITITVLDWLFWLSFVKLAVTVAKYIPQAALNFRRRSTVGWNIYNVLCDFAGGLLSLAQVFVDVSIQGSWSAVIGDPVKFGLGFNSLLFDLIFMVQHFCLYPVRDPTSASKRCDDSERDQLVPLTEEPDEE